MELSDDDLLVVDEAPVSTAAPRNADQAETLLREARRRLTIPPPSMRPIDEAMEDDVAGECLASIAKEAASHSRIRAVAKRASPSGASAPPHAREALGSSYTIPAAAKLPSVTSPPFVRGSTAPGVRDSSVFARTSSSTPRMPAALPAATPKIAAVAEKEAGVAAGSVAPVAISVTPSERPRDGEPRAIEPTVIVLREKPKAGWIVAAAAVGALCALAIVRLVSPPVPDDRFSTTTIATAVMQGPTLPPPPLPTSLLPINPMLQNGTPPAPPSTPAATATAAAPSTTGAVVRFGDDQGVAIGVAPKSNTSNAAAPSNGAPAKAAAPAKVPFAPKPVKPVKNGPLPDGSIPLGQGESKSAAAPASSPPTSASQAERAAQAALASSILPAATTTTAAPAAPEPPAPPARKRSLTPEQQIAEAQLKASMK